MNNIAKFPLKLIKNILVLVVILGLNDLSFSKTSQSFIENPAGIKVSLRFAITKEEHTKGLSGIKSSDFKESEGMLFINTNNAPRKFWMPDTYFNLDIIFLDPTLKIVGISKDSPFHPGTQEPPNIYRTETYLAQYILEVKSKSKFSKNLKKGDQLKFIGRTSLLGIAQGTHLPQ